MDTQFPHDRIFKTLMSDPALAVDFLKHYLPENVLSSINFNTLVLCPETHINEQLELLSTDILFQVNIANQTSFIYILFEHQSNVNFLMPFRILQYIIEIWSKHINNSKKNTLPLIIPIVFYHGKKPYDGPTNIRDLIDGPTELIDSFLFSTFHLIDTNKIPDEKFKQQHLAGFMCFIMKKIYARDFMNSKGIIYDMLTNIIKKEGADALVSVVTLLNYLVRYGNIDEPKMFITEVGEVLSISKEVEEKFMGTVADYLRNEGRQEGREEVRKEILQRIITIKFGANPNTYKDKIDSATPKLLEKWVDKLLISNNINQVFEE